MYILIHPGAFSAVPGEHTLKLKFWRFCAALFGQLSLLVKVAAKVAL